MRAVKYDFRSNDDLHLSDFDLCILVPFYRRVLDDPPTMFNDAALKFLRGRVVERAISEEMEPMAVDDIYMTIDGTHPDGIPIEIKSTAEGSEFFDPKRNEHWIRRSMGYCLGYKVNEIYLVVYFLSGNMSDYLPWAIKRNKKTPDKYQSVSLRAWELEFTDKELQDNWTETLRRKAVLQEALRSGEPPDEAEVKRTYQEWQCKGCEMNVACYFFKNKIYGGKGK
jgi:hypothetical protein